MNLKVERNTREREREKHREEYLPLSGLFPTMISAGWSQGNREIRKSVGVFCGGDRFKHLIINYCLPACTLVGI